MDGSALRHIATSFVVFLALCVGNDKCGAATESSPLPKSNEFDISLPDVWYANVLNVLTNGNIMIGGWSFDDDARPTESNVKITILDSDGRIISQRDLVRPEKFNFLGGSVALHSGEYLVWGTSNAEGNGEPSTHFYWFSATGEFIRWLPLEKKLALSVIELRSGRLAVLYEGGEDRNVDLIFYTTDGTHQKTVNIESGIYFPALAENNGDLVIAGINSVVGSSLFGRFVQLGVNQLSGELVWKNSLPSCGGSYVDSTQSLSLADGGHIFFSNCLRGSDNASSVNPRLVRLAADGHLLWDFMPDFPTGRESSEYISLFEDEGGAFSAVGFSRIIAPLGEKCAPFVVSHSQNGQKVDERLLNVDLPCFNPMLYTARALDNVYLFMHLASRESGVKLMKRNL